MTNTQVISRVVLKASVHRVPGKPTTKPRSRGPQGATRQIKEIITTTNVEDWDIRWAAAIDILTNGVKYTAPPKPKPKPEPKAEAKPAAKVAAKPAAKPAAKKSE
jgi:hypothetical protein